MGKKIITNDRQALEIALRDYKKHLVLFRNYGDSMHLIDYIRNEYLECGICHYMYRKYSYKSLYDFFRLELDHAGYIPMSFDPKLTTYEVFILSLKNRIAWLENYLKENG
jgi:hypothetical protein